MPKELERSFLIWLIVFVVLTFFPACATLHKPLPIEPLSDHEKITIISRIQVQEKKVFSFYSIGSISVKNWIWESKSNILVVGAKNPFKIKIEITHPWGQPILHVLMNKTKLEILSFPDKKLYLGTFTPEALLKYFPWDLNAQLIWAALRGYPNLTGHHRIVSLKANQISLFNRKEKEVEIIDLYPETHLPKRVSFPREHVDLDFLKFQEESGIYYAREVRVKSTKRKRNLVLKNKKMVFNKTIPEQIFILEKPPAFGIFPLDE